MALEKPSELLKLESYQTLKSFSSLKGFLKPFKGKGDYEILRQQSLELRDALNQFVRDIALLTKSPPWSLLDIELRSHISSEVGSIFLRWRSRDLKNMGVHLWEAQMLNPKTPECLLEELHVIEQMRIAINMQVSISQNMLKLANANMKKSVLAEEVLARRRRGETVVRSPVPAMKPEDGRKKETKQKRLY